MENQYRGADCLKRRERPLTVCQFKGGGLGKKEGGGVNTPMHTMERLQTLLQALSLKCSMTL